MYGVLLTYIDENIVEISAKMSVSLQTEQWNWDDKSFSADVKASKRQKLGGGIKKGSNKCYLYEIYLAVHILLYIIVDIIFRIYSKP